MDCLENRLNDDVMSIINKKLHHLNQCEVIKQIKEKKTTPCFMCGYDVFTINVGCGGSVCYNCLHYDLWEHVYMRKRIKNFIPNKSFLRYGNDNEHSIFSDSDSD
jgi:hypothetical protein